MMLRCPRRRAILAPILALLLAGCAAFGVPAGGPGLGGLVAAEIALERADYALAARLYGRAAAEHHDDALAERALRIAFDHSQERVLVQLARDWLRRDPKSETARRFLVVGLLELDDRDAAGGELAALLGTAYPTPAEGFRAFGASFGQLRNDSGVADVMGRLAARHPDVPEAALTAATLWLSAGNSPAALAAAARALELRPDWRAARSLVARARVAGGDCEGGLRDSGTLAADAGDGDRLLNAWLLSACDRGAQARAAFSDLLESRIARPEALEGLAGFDIDAGRYDEATMRLSELLATGRNGDRAMYALALVADRKGEYPRSVLLYGRVTGGTRAVAAQLRAYRLGIDHGQAVVAARQLDEFLAGAPEFRVEAAAARAQIMADTGRVAEALALLGRTRAAYPDRAEPRYACATVFEGAGRLEEALATLRAVVHDRPRDPSALNALGYTLADHERELPEAERLIRAAWSERPDSAAIRDSLGWVLHRRGQDAQALPWLQQAYRLEPDGEIATHLGLVQWELGDQAGAIRTWKSGLERSPGERHLEQALASHPGPVT
jgi:tetratricopeptide (TPR) repeat protein